METQPSDFHIARHLESGGFGHRVERLRLGSSEPLMFEVIWVPSTSAQTFTCMTWPTCR